MKNEPLPQICLIRDTDLITFAYELHIFARLEVMSIGRQFTT